MIQPRTLKGFRDFLPKEARKRQFVIDKLRSVFESYGFEPLETPVLEYEEILAGKYGDEGDRLMYKFKDNGDRAVAMRYDQTVPLARVIAQFKNELPLPFKRYQISNVWRAENTQRGRFREFTQCDIDTVGTTSLLADAEIITTAVNSLQKLGFKKFKVLINDRKNLSNDLLSEKENITAVRAIDKIKKIGREGVLKELESSGFSKGMAVSILETFETKKPNENIKGVINLLRELKLKDEIFEFDPFLARGLDYYTGTIFEIEIDGYDAGSVCGGGRYDNLIGMFGSTPVPAVGCAFGFDRVIEAMDSLGLFPDELQTTKVLVTVFSPDLVEKSIETASTLREKGINAEIYLDANAKMEKQLKYADAKQISYVVIIGPKEVENNTVTIKNFKTREQKTVKIEDMANIVK